MKDRKTLSMQNLINETIRQLAHRFTPSLPMVKHAIERLIDKEYLERNADDRKSLNYLVRLSLNLSRLTGTDFVDSNRLETVCRLHPYPPSLLFTLLYILLCLSSAVIAVFDRRASSATDGSFSDSAVHFL